VDKFGLSTLVHRAGDDLPSARKVLQDVPTVQEDGPEMKWCVVLLHWDYSGVQKVFGPYESKEDATAAISLLMQITDVGGVYEATPLISIGGY
jgi:hypothetical protein